ncbi:MAG: PqqD family peptide modification chaperone [Deltaproteobacteria bacterium]|nr:PqqD family peptide modification chaperone [Deltaproteobacteria bacterium]
MAVASVGAEAVLLDLQTYDAARANAAAALILRLADGRRDEAALATALAAAAGVPLRRARDDVRRLVRALARRGFLTPGAG